MSDAKSVPATVLAAGTQSDPVATAASVPHKAMAQVAGRCLVNRVIGALQKARSVADIVVVTAPNSPVQQILPPGVPWTESEGESFVDTITAGLDYHSGHEYTLLATCDLALLTPEAVDHFVSEALDSGAELCYSMVRAERSEPLYETAGHVLVRLRDGSFTGGNLALVGREFIRRQGQHLKRAFAGRKNPIRLARLLGGTFIWRYLTGRLAVPDIVERARQILGCEAMVVDSPYPEICFDLDKPEHIAIAERHLQGRLPEAGA